MTTSTSRMGMVLPISTSRLLSPITPKKKYLPPSRLSPHRDVLEPWLQTEIGSQVSRRSLRGTPGLTAGFSYCRRKLSIISPAIKPYGKASRWNAWRARDSLRRTHTTASGTRWTHSATRINLKQCGVPEKLHGKFGHEPGLLADEKGFSHGSHRLQGKLAVPVAPESGCGGHWLLPGPTIPAESV